MSGDESISKSRIDWLLILKKDLKSFEVDSNLEEARWVNFILESVDWLLEAKDNWDDEFLSISFMFEVRKDDIFS